MKKFTYWQLIVAFLFITNISYSQIISQYVETSSGSVPKGIEVWNNTAGVLDFAANNLIVKKGTNGSSPNVDFTLSSGTLAADAVIVIGTADMEATATGNGAAFALKAFQFNGDDALEIWYGATKTDIFGEPGSDPGSAWSANGVETRNSNISLKAGISNGSLTGWTDPSVRFETTCTDNCLTGFGIAPVGGGGGGDVAPPTFTPSGGTYFVAQDVTISTATVGADIYYTLDGTDPDNTSTAYAAPINIAANTTLKAIAIDPAAILADSPISTATYTITVPVAMATVADLRAGATDGTIYQLNGEALLTFQQSYRKQKFVQDATAGILIDDNSGKISAVLNIGDGLTGMIGTLNTYKGMLQFIPMTDPGAATSTGNVITPLLLTAAEFNTNFENYEGMLVQVDNLTFADAGSTFTNGQVYATTDPNTVGVDFRASFYGVDYIGSTIASGGRDIVGIANERDFPYLTARNAADIVNHAPVIPLGSTGIMIAGLLMAAVLVVRKGRLF